MRISDWSSDVCSSDLDSSQLAAAVNGFVAQAHKGTRTGNIVLHKYLKSTKWAEKALNTEAEDRLTDLVVLFQEYGDRYGFRSEEHTSELQSLMRISYAVFCLKKKKKTNNKTP